MKRSTDRILTTHTGSLPRPADVDQMLFDREEGQPVDERAFGQRVASAVAQTVARQLDAGVDVVNDGETGKIGFSTYVKERLSGFGGEPGLLVHAEMAEFPEVVQPLVQMPGYIHMKRPSCDGPITPRDPAAVQTEIGNLTAAVADRKATELFLTAASPGIIATFLANRYYPSYEEYLFALAEAMKPEYEAIAGAGIVLQLDSPDLAMGRVMGGNADLSDAQFRDQIRLHIRALNHAVRDIAPKQMRMHVCWGNGEFPHVRDIPLQDILDIVLEARPTGLMLEGANPRHEHEWELWQDIELPDGKILIPGVLDTTTNYVEHPELVAQRLIRYAQMVGKENIIAGTDCGFATFAGVHSVNPRVTWLKLTALAGGAQIASGQLW